MKWFKHDTDANMDAKLQKVLIDYGLEGYGLYWYCIELIAARVDKEHITFELEHDASIIAHNVNSSEQRISEIMFRFVELGLFENSSGIITCIKIAKRLDKSMTNSQMMRQLIDQFKASGNVMTSHDDVRECHARSDKNRSDKNININTTKSKLTEVNYHPDCDRVIEYLSEATRTKFKKVDTNRKLISGRLKDGYTFEDCCMVIDAKVKDWSTSRKYSNYLRPSTLFSPTNFPGYLQSARLIALPQKFNDDEVL